MCLKDVQHAGQEEGRRESRPVLCKEVHVCPLFTARCGSIDEWRHVAVTGSRGQLLPVGKNSSLEEQRSRSA